MAWQRVAIVGVGLLGGSVGMKLKQSRLAGEVVGVGRDALKLNKALTLGAIDRAVLRDDSDWLKHIAGSDVIVICTPVQEIIPLVHQIVNALGLDATITDVGSTKAEIVAQLSGLPGEQCFVGSHPLAGSEKSGVESATSSLFEKKLVFITPSPNCSDQRVAKVTQFWTELGSIVQSISASEHDEVLATTSHLPHVVASILAGITPAEWLGMTGTGWSDSTRIAAGSPLVWRQILEENHLPVLQAMDKFATILGQWSEAIRAKDFDKIEQLLSAGKQIRDALGNRHTSS